MSLNIKLLAVQKDIKAITKSESNPFFKSKYFDINLVVAALRPVFNDNGIVVLQPLAELNGKPAIRTLVLDSETGESIDSITPLIENSDPQKFGGIITYTRRYALTSMFLLEGEDDDDANRASGNVSKAPVSTPVPPQSTTTAKCDKCDAPMKVSSAGKPYCSKLCWKNPVQALPVIQQEVQLSDVPF